MNARGIPPAAHQVLHLLSYPVEGVPHLWKGGVLHLWPGDPSPVWTWLGYPPSGPGQVPPPIWTWMGCPHVWIGQGTP